MGLAACDHASELTAAAAQLRRRWPEPLTNDRERQRAFGVLIRLGFDSEVAYDAIRAQSDPVGGPLRAH